MIEFKLSFIECLINFTTLRMVFVSKYVCDNFHIILKNFYY